MVFGKNDKKSEQNVKNKSLEFFFIEAFTKLSQRVQNPFPCSISVKYTLTIWKSYGGTHTHKRTDDNDDICLFSFPLSFFIYVHT